MGHIDQGCLSGNTPLQLALGSPFPALEYHCWRCTSVVAVFATSCCFLLSSSAVVFAIGHCYSLPLSSSLDLVDLFPDSGCPFLTPASAFLSSIHVFRCRHVGAMRAILPLSLASLVERLALLGKGYVLIFGSWSGSSEGLIGVFSPQRKERRKHLVEWMEKSSFTRLNKLFEIDTSKRAYKVFLSDKNLLALIDNPKPFIIPVFPRLALPSLTRLEEQERKRQEGTLRQVPTAGRPFSSSVVRPPTQKRKEPAAHPVWRVRTSPPTSPSSLSTLSSLSSLSSSSSSDKPEAGVDGVVPRIICEEEEEDDEDMTSNLRAGFPPPPVLIPSVTAATVILESDEKLPSVDDIAYHETRKPFVVMENLSEESFECMASSLPRLKSAYVLNRDEISKLLKRQSQLILHNTASVWYSDTAIGHILHIQDCMTFETTEVVIVGVRNLMRQHTHLFHLLEAAKTMRAYVTHNMDENEDLLASLETTKSKAVVA
ncbi:hypothetical protein CK203_033943 [Vitis vinifera]|uniref:Uncharacterized protein n=1 Tax=Vitis vinifera TaxID=29760 RepID=A0A438HU58_VITVI|nr:hypothetical protein CK203_033943 [Vitis vinifera]